MFKNELGIKKVKNELRIKNVKNEVGIKLFINELEWCYKKWVGILK